MRRITSRPFRIRFSVTETGANTFTQADIELPVAVLAGGKVQAIEIGKVVAQMPTPDVEDDQNNQVDFQVTRDSQAAIIGWTDDDQIHRINYTIEDDFTTSGGRLTQVINPVMHDLTWEGDGVVVMERTIHVGVAGTGNAGAKGVTGYLLCHLVELSPAEVTVNLFLDDDN